MLDVIRGVDTRKKKHNNYNNNLLGDQLVKFTDEARVPSASLRTKFPSGRSCRVAFSQTGLFLFADHIRWLKYRLTFPTLQSVQVLAIPTAKKTP